MAEQLSGKVAIVTGGASGLGRAIAELFVEEGARVVIADVDAERGDALRATLGDAALFKRTDVAAAEEVQDLVDFAVARAGGLDVMVNNAGISGPMRRFLDDEFADFHRNLDVNLLGVMLGSQRAARHMAKNGGGAIVNLSSIAALKPGSGVMTYRAAKAAVLQFSRSIAIELAPFAIRVNCIAPGHIQTDMTSYDMARVVELTQPLKRQGTPHDVAEAALYLASERSAQVTGLVIPVDGGTTLGTPVDQLQGVLSGREGKGAR
jgi:NAD(P)-dependent dehydrogenase (short-subunit alcohol dehydrogenase family)